MNFPFTGIVDSTFIVVRNLRESTIIGGMPSPSIPKNSVLSRRLRQARLLRELSQDGLGVLAGLDESSSSARMSRYESGIHEPPHQFVEAMAKVLGISAAFFYCADDRLADIILAYSGMSESKRKSLYESAIKIADNVI